MSAPEVPQRTEVRHYLLRLAEAGHVMRVAGLVRLDGRTAPGAAVACLEELRQEGLIGWWTEGPMELGLLTREGEDVLYRWDDDLLGLLGGGET